MILVLFVFMNLIATTIVIVRIHSATKHKCDYKLPVEDTQSEAATEVRT